MLPLFAKSVSVMTSMVILFGGPRDGTILSVSRLETYIQFPVPPKIELHNKETDCYVPMRIFVYKRIPGLLDYSFIGVE